MSLARILPRILVVYSVTQCFVLDRSTACSETKIIYLRPIVNNMGTDQICL